MRPENLKNPRDKQITTQYASSNDIQGILSVQKENLLSVKAPNLLSEQGSETNEDTKEIEREGFLIHAVTQEELEKLITDKQNIILLVTKENDEVDGYALAYDLNIWKRFKPQWEKNIRVPQDMFELLSEEKILYLRHIARKKSAKGRGSRLMEMLINEARSRGYKYIICEILEKPITNKASIEFHQRFGFNEIGQVEENENFIWGLFIKKL